MRVFVLFVTFKMSQIWNRKNFYIYIYIYINLPKLGFYGLDTVPFRPCIFTVFQNCIFFVLKWRFCRFCRIYIHTGEKKIKKAWSRKRKNFLYI